MQRDHQNHASKPQENTGNTHTQRNIWENYATPLPQSAKEDPHGHIAFYRAIELM